MRRTLKEWRAHHNLTMVDAANYLDIHYVTYSKLEKKPELITVKQAWQLAELFECETKDILFFNRKSNLKLKRTIAI